MELQNVNQILLDSIEQMTRTIKEMSDKIDAKGFQSELITEDDVARIWGFSKSVQADMRKEGQLIKVSVFGRRNVLYRRSEVEATLLKNAH